MSEVPKIIYNKNNSGTGQAKDLDAQWWVGDAERCYEKIFPLVTYIRQTQDMRHSSNKLFYSLYSNRELDRSQSAMLLNQSAQYFGKSSRRTFNVVKSCVDTARSKIVKQRPRPFFLTENGNFDLRERSKKLNSFILAFFEQIGSPNGLIRESLYNIGSEVFQDACITGTGAAKMGIYSGNRVVAERFLSDEIIVDQYDGMYRTPRSMHQIKYIDRQVLFDTYPEAKYRYMIQSAKRQNPGASGFAQDIVPVIESYHLPSGPKAKDGKRSVCLQTGTLHYSEWDRPYFPFLVQRWCLSPIGYFGIGLAEELQGIQADITRLLQDIHVGLRRVARPRVGLHITDLNSKKNITNEIGQFYYYKERPPVFDTPSAFNTETYNHLDRLFSKAYELTGISQLSSTSRKPSGLDAAVALREYQDIESERFATVHMMYENFFTPQATYMALDLLDQLLEAGVDTTVQARDGVTQEAIKYSDVQLPPDSFTVRPYATAYLPADPAGKFAKAQELAQSGMYSQDEVRELLDFPDLKKIDRVKNAIRNSVNAYVEDILKTGEYKPVEPYQDLVMTRDLAQSYYLTGKIDKMPEKLLNLLRRIMQECKDRLDEAESEQMRKQQEMMAMQAPPLAESPLQQTTEPLPEMELPSELGPVV